MSSLLITGGAGFIGSNFVHYWVRRHPEDRVVVLDALTYAGNLANLEVLLHRPQLRFVEGDVCDRELLEGLMAEERVDRVMHFAAESHVDRSIRGPEEFIRTNVQGTLSLLMAARAVWHGQYEGKRLTHVSTDEVYGSLGPDDPAFKETTAYAPNSPYAASKAASDHLVRAYHHTHGLPTVITNCSNNYGPYQFPEKFIPLMVVNALEGKQLPVYGDGMNVRDWLHVEDHCGGLELALRDGRAGECYNLGGRCERPNVEVVRLICQLVADLFEKRPELATRFPSCPAAHGRPVGELITYVEDRPGHDRRYAVDISRAAAELGYEPRIRFEDGMRATIEWYVDNESWWRAILSGSYREWVALHYKSLATART